ncbi:MULTISPECIES: helix-turn-helix domain-containing protein [Aquimarina]|uniref:Helix-turn-helix transcriptional regulator n=1 Tax=Aquimarina algiphila TaxID=2047982 RepID=A0A554VCJ6_9FLAO|nr:MULTISPECIES: helix-turn-helix transcriptional regulator [Aquimarina]TSE04404.1 helix-turn-helix transcriptional regulator [Aquimarina algiphila]
MSEHPVDIYVGKRLRIKRNSLEMSQDELAKAIGVTFQQIQKYEKGKNRISSSRLYELKKALNCSMEYFFDGFDDQTSDSQLLQEPSVDEKEWLKIRSNFCRLPIGIQQSFRKLINSIND